MIIGGSYPIEKKAPKPWNLTYLKTHRRAFWTPLIPSVRERVVKPSNVNVNVN